MTTINAPISDVVSSTKAVVVVDAEKQVRICLAGNYMSSGNGVEFDVDLRLSMRGSDFNVYANTGYEENNKDTNLLVSILNGLLGPRTGVESIRVGVFGLFIQASRAVTVESITRLIVDSAERAGYLVELEDLTGSLVRQ